MKKVIFAILLIIIASFVISISLYQMAPENIPSHWNIRGEVDSYMPKFWGLFLMPIISVALLLLFLIIPKIDPYKKNIAKFRNYYNWFIFAILLFLFYIYFLTIMYTFGFRFNMSNAILPAIAVLIYLISVLLKHSKRNYFIGIRTPWTIQNEKVWDKTHELGSKMYAVLSVIVLLSVFIVNYSFYILLGSIFLTVIYLTLYSYYLYKKYEK